MNHDDAARRRALLAGAGMLLITSLPARAEDTWALITPEQYAQEVKAREAGVAETPVSLRRGLFPAIRVIAPAAGETELASPLRIELRFDTSPDARIVPSTFRMLYGLLKFDLTDTLRGHARLSEQGAVIEQAVLPPGMHRLLLQIADDRGRVSEQELRLKVR